jgi:hypothetical protein
MVAVMGFLKKPSDSKRSESTMRLISRQRAARRGTAPRIAISQAEITADLHYPAAARTAPVAGSGRRGARR